MKQVMVYQFYTPKPVKQIEELAALLNDDWQIQSTVIEPDLENGSYIYYTLVRDTAPESNRRITDFIDESNRLRVQLDLLRNESNGTINDVKIENSLVKGRAESAEKQVVEIMAELKQLRDQVRSQGQQVEDLRAQLDIVTTNPEMAIAQDVTSIRRRLGIGTTA
jgi:regulator of replication initiation timing